MKYFSPSYWFKLWVLSAPLFNDKTQGINAMSIDNKKIKDWASNSTSLESINQEMSYSNSSINYQLYNLNQTNQNINPIYQTELKTSTHKHRHEKSRKRLKRTLNSENEIEYQSWPYYKLYISLTPKFWEEVIFLNKRNKISIDDTFKFYGYEVISERESFGNKIAEKLQKCNSIDHRVSGDIDYLKTVGHELFWNWDKVNNVWKNSNRKERIKLEFNSKWTQNSMKPYVVFVSANIIKADTYYYPNPYLENLKRDFPDYDKESINLGIVNNLNPKTTIEDDIKQSIKYKYPNFVVEQISITNWENYSHFCRCFKFELNIPIPNYYSYGKIKPKFSCVTQTKLNEISNIIANDPKTKQWIAHINDYNKNLPTKIERLKSYTDSQKWSAKNTEKEIIKSYIRDWSYIHTLIEHELKLDELNKNIQGLKSSFDNIKNQVNDLDKRVQNLENTSNWNCANIATITSAGISVVPVIGTIGGAVATVTAGACAIAGV